MKKITNILELKDAIYELELKLVNEKIAMKDQLKTVKESLKPLNLIKSTFKSAGTSDIKENMITGVIGLAAGYLAKKVVFGSSINPLKKIAGTLLQIAVAGSAPTIKSAGAGLFKHFFKRGSDHKLENTPKASDEIHDLSI